MGHYRGLEICLRKTESDEREQVRKEVGNVERKKSFEIIL